MVGSVVGYILEDSCDKMETRASDLLLLGFYWRENQQMYACCEGRFWSFGGEILIFEIMQSVCWWCGHFSLNSISCSFVGLNKGIRKLWYLTFYVIHQMYYVKVLNLLLSFEYSDVNWPVLTIEISLVPEKFCSGLVHSWIFRANRIIRNTR